VATAAPVVPARGQDGPLRRASAHDGGSDHPRGDAFDAGVAVIDWQAVSAARLAECLPAGAARVNAIGPDGPHALKVRIVSTDLDRWLQ
jgi:hypothetical protein